MNELSIERVLPHLPTALTWALALALGVQAALIVRTLIQPLQSTSRAAVHESVRKPAEANGQFVDVQSILNAHLFGTPAAAGGSSATEVVDAPQTQLNLILTGTIAVNDPKKGMGLIGDSAANAKVYSVGEAISGGGVQLHAVYADRVLLNRNGQLEALYMPRQRASNGRAAARAPAGAGLADRVRQMVNENPGAIAEIMRPQPVFANGMQRGFRVYPGRNRDQFARLGLMPGDLVTAINGTPLDDPARSMEIFQSINSASEVNVTLERAGQKQNLTLDMTQLAQQAQALSAAPPEDAPSTPPAEEQTLSFEEERAAAPPPEIEPE